MIVVSVVIYLLMSQKATNCCKPSEGLDLECRRSIVHGKLMLTRALIMEHMKLDKLDQLETEEEILAAAVALTR